MKFVGSMNRQRNNETTTTNEETVKVVEHSEPQPASLPSDEPAEEKESNEAQQAADDYFQSLLEQAQLKRQRRRQQYVDVTQQQQQQQQEALPPMNYFGTQQPDESPLHTKQKDPTIAKWEKHEKGIGSKLLFKMGWKGSGGLGSDRRKAKPSLGNAAAPSIPSADDNKVDPKDSSPAASRKGISQPIEVVVRPANMGLGFGTFKEQSQLKANRKIEAAVRGFDVSEVKTKKRGVMDFDDDGAVYDDNEEDDAQPSNRSSSSVIPTTQELMTQKGWKRRKTKRAAPKIIPYEDLVKLQDLTRSEGPVIIDMRGPSASSAGTTEGNVAADGKVPLGEELLHNVTFMLNTYENQLYSQSQMLKSIVRKEKSLQSEILDLKRQQEEARDRREKLEETLSVVQRVEDLVTQPLSGNNAQLDQVIEWIQRLAASFSSEDRNSLQFWQALAPALLSPVLHIRLQKWDPLGSIDIAHELLHSMFHMQIHVSNTEDRPAIDEMRFSILQNLLLPRVQQVLESNSWNPCTQTDVVVDMCEYIISLATKLGPKKGKEGVTYPEDQVFSGGAPVDEYIDTLQTSSDFAEIVRKQLVLETVFPKLQTALRLWKPSLSKGGSNLDDRLDLWILPWMPHMDHPVIFAELLSECKRKLKSSLAYLQRKIGKGSDIEFVKACTEILKPWARVYDSKQLQRLVSEYTTAYLARALAKQKIKEKATEQDWTLVRLTFDLHGAGLLSDIEFLSLFEAELLPRWVDKLVDMIVLQRMNATEAAAIYIEWKAKIMLHTDTQSHTSSQKLLRNDPIVCAIFCAVLRIIEQATRSNLEDVESLRPPHTSYHLASARRHKVQQLQVQDDYTRMESRSKIEIDARIRLRRRQIETPTFRDVVEEFARENGILFQPRMGAKALKDGKQVFLFGRVAIYIEGDVIYASQQASDWRPISLDQLMESAAASDN
jgi:hypothetical protein